MAHRRDQRIRDLSNLSPVEREQTHAHAGHGPEDGVDRRICGRDPADPREVRKGLDRSSFSGLIKMMIGQNNLPGRYNQGKSTTKYQR